MKKFELKISEPTVLFQGKVGDNAWGHNQFPRLLATKMGGIQASWEYTSDTIKYDGTFSELYTYDGGNTWGAMKEGDKVAFAHELVNDGKYFAAFKRVGAYKVEHLKNYTPAFVFDGKKPVHAPPTGKMYFADDIKEDEGKKVFGIEVDVNTGEKREIECEIEWPFMALRTASKTDDLLFPTTTRFSLANKNGIVSHEGALYCSTYGHGFNSSADCKENAITKYPNFSNVYVFKSCDFGHSWKYLSQISVTDEVNKENEKTDYIEGFTEPMMNVMPDGSFIMLMRTGFTNPTANTDYRKNPIYICRSTDKGKTWTAPVAFDDIGVRPQILTLPCNVTIATYGRPILKLRATSDESGVEWADPITIPLTPGEDTNFMKHSCFYTNLLTTGYNSCIMIYSDFNYPNADGIPVKSIMIRKITVEVSEEA